MSDLFELLEELRLKSEKEIELNKKLNKEELELKIDKIELKQEMPYCELKTDKAKNEAILIDTQERSNTIIENKSEKEKLLLDIKILEYKLKDCITKEVRDIELLKREKEGG